MRTYAQAPAGAHLGFWPSVYVLPATMDGLRVVAREAMSLGDRQLLDQLELQAIEALHIEPADVLMQKDEKPVPLRIFSEAGGLVVEWVIYSAAPECPACEGSGELVASGLDGRDYEVECPGCHGSGEADDVDERTVFTDIDGHFIREA